jgi:hypothetical protein
LPEFWYDRNDGVEQLFENGLGALLMNFGDEQISENGGERGLIDYPAGWHQGYEQGQSVHNLRFGEIRDDYYGTITGGRMISCRVRPQGAISRCVQALTIVWSSFHYSTRVVVRTISGVHYLMEQTHGASPKEIYAIAFTAGMAIVAH